MPRLHEVVEATRAVVVPTLAHRARALKMTKMTLKARPVATARTGASRRRGRAWTAVV